METSQTRGKKLVGAQAGDLPCQGLGSPNPTANSRQVCDHGGPRQRLVSWLVLRVEWGGRGGHKETTSCSYTGCALGKKGVESHNIAGCAIGGQSVMDIAGCAI